MEKAIFPVYKKGPSSAILLICARLNKLRRIQSKVTRVFFIGGKYSLSSQGLRMIPEARAAGFKVGNGGCLPWAKQFRYGRTIRSARFGSLRSAQRMSRKREGFWRLRLCSTGHRERTRRRSAGWIARRCGTG